MRLPRNALLNLLGHAAPLVAALLVVPFLVSRLDPSQFGFLSLAWVIVGYFSLFDLGLGRALSRLVAERLGTTREAELPVHVRTALVLTFALGAVTGLVLFAASAWICANALKLPEALRTEAVTALQILALCLPLVSLAAALRGLLEAGHHFGWVNAIRVPLGVLTYAGPAAAVALAPGLVPMVWVLAVLRLVTLVAHIEVCRRLYPGLVRLGMPNSAALREMLGYGAWLTVSNVVGPLMVYADRFAIGTLLAVSAVGYYTAPYEIMTRLWIIPAALTGVLFPAFASETAERARDLYRTGANAVIVSVIPIAFIATLYAPEALHLWLGGSYAAQSARVAQVLALGVTLNCLAYIPFTLLQAHDRADLTAKLHLVELPFYLLALVWMVSTFGILGAALAWAGRCAFDAIVLFVLAGRYSRIRLPLYSASQWLVLAVVLGMLAVALAPMPGQWGAKAAYFCFSALTFPWLIWHFLFGPVDREYVRRLARLGKAAPP